jgi:carbon-monoxide dehydrogenase small subunit
MEIRQTIQVSRPPNEVWTFLGDVPAVVACIPGAELGAALGGNRYGGSFRVKVGPLSAKVEGEGEITRNDAERRGQITGRGVDKRGGSRVGVTMDYAVVPDGTGSAITVTAETDLSGPLAQVGRTGIIEDVVRRLTEEFTKALEARLNAKSSDAAPSNGIADAGARAKTRAFDAGGAVSAGLMARLGAFLMRLFGL